LVTDPTRISSDAQGRGCELERDELPTFHILYRTTARENRKPRPPWYDKGVALASALRAANECDFSIEVHLLADGELSPEISERASAANLKQARINGGSNRRSFLATLRYARGVSTSSDDFIWLSEDDYLYAPESFVRVQEAREKIREADYFALYTPDDFAWHNMHPSQPVRSIPYETWTLSADWARIISTTSTFGARASALFSDEWLLRLCVLAGGPFAPSCSMALQGVAPFSYLNIHRDLNWRPSIAGTRNALFRPPMRLMVNVATLYQTWRRRLLVSPMEDLATHMEDGFISPARDWERLAGQIRLR
jgi:hypothetical protein